MRKRFRVRRKRGAPYMLDLLLPVAFFVLVLGLFFYGMDTLGEAAVGERAAAAENAVRKAAVQCYALEGQYPPDVDYMREHYGLSVDAAKYTIHYEIFASNIMPQIIVIPIETDESVPWMGGTPYGEL